MVDESHAKHAGRGKLNLENKIAVVVGGSGAIGAAVVRKLAVEGARVAIGYHRSVESASVLKSELPGTDHLVVHLPVENSAALISGAEVVREAYGQVDVLVNAAGVTSAIEHGDLDSLDDATFDRILTTNVRGAFAVVRSFIPLLRMSPDAVIVNVSSISATTGLGSNIAYCASKAALDTMGMSLARVLGPNIRVIGVSPAAVATTFVPGRGRLGAEQQAAKTPLKTVTEADDVALAIIATITHFRLTTGSVFVVDGGRHL